MTIQEIQDHYDNICGPYINIKDAGIVLDGLFSLEELKNIIEAYKQYLKEENA